MYHLVSGTRRIVVIVIETENDDIDVGIDIMSIYDIYSLLT